MEPTYAPLVNAAEARALVDAGATVLDTRSALRFLTDGHIRGASRVSWRLGTSGARQDGALGPPDEAAAAFAAVGVHDERPVLAVGDWDAGWGEEGRIFWSLEYLGHPRVHVLRGGMRAWDGPRAHLAGAPRPGRFTARPRPELRVTTAELAAALDGPEPVTVIDVREAAEFDGTPTHGEARAGHIPGAVSAPWRSLLAGAVPDVRGRVVLTCTGGVRSGMAYVMLRQLNVSHVANHDAGMWSWTLSNHPMR